MYEVNKDTNLLKKTRLKSLMNKFTLRLMLNFKNPQPNQHHMHQTHHRHKTSEIVHNRKITRSFLQQTRIDFG